MHLLIALHIKPTCWMRIHVHVLVFTDNWSLRLFTVYITNFTMTICIDYNICWFAIWSRICHFKRLHYAHKVVYLNICKKIFKFIKTVLFVFLVFLEFDFCRFCEVIWFFHPSHNSQWPPTLKDPWLGIVPGISRTRSQHSTTRISRRL